MTRIERRLLERSLAVCLTVTLLVILLDRWGLLAAPERWLYDRRAADCQFFMPPPTDRLIHLDIDDPTLDAIGAWPWPRTRLALMIDEIRRAGASALALDVILSEPQQPRSEPGPDGKPGPLIDDDANLARAFSQFGRIMVPMPFTYEDIATPQQQQLRKIIAEILQHNLELELDDLVAALRSRPEFDRIPDAQLRREVEDYFPPTRRGVVFDRLYEELEVQNQPWESLRRKLLPGLDPTITGHALLRLLESQHDKVISVRTLSKLVPETPKGLPTLLDRRVDMPPIPRFASVATHTGVLNYLADGDGVLRSTPLWIQHKGHIYPQLGLALACMHLGVELKDVRLTGDRIEIPLKDRAPLVIPVRYQFIRSQNHYVSMFMDVPWFGPPNRWELMYDPLRQRPEQHLPMLRVWQVIMTRQRIERNNATLDDALLHLLDQFNEREPFEEFKKLHTQLGPLDTDARKSWIKTTQTKWDELTKDMTSLSLVELQKTPAAQRSPEESQILRSLQDLVQVPTRNAELTKDLMEMERRLREIFNGRAVLMGWTATGAAADFLPTSLHAKCPGPVVHGVIFNGILTGELWRATPPWVTFAVTALVGIFATLLTVLLSPGRSLLAATGLGIAYLLINGILLFDYGNILVGLAGPLTAIAAVWAGGTLYRFVAERRERNRIVARFQNYVDPALVNYVLQNERATFDGEEREMTVVFTDLAGFTTISERLREKTVPLLNKYISLMVPLIREQDGFVNKFLGDGIMFFYGAPLWRDDHALQAVNTVLRMQQAIPEFNALLEKDGLPPVKMRAGVASGMMTVGDAGGAGRSDYTVLGDTVNFAARLESANKATGTLTLISERTAKLVREKNLFLLRPVGKLQVVGKSEYVMTYEPIALLDQATPQQKRLVQITQIMIDLYQSGEFIACLNVVDELEKEFGQSTLTGLYRKLCRLYMAEPPTDGFDGQIVLAEK